MQLTILPGHYELRGRFFTGDEKKVFMQCLKANGIQIYPSYEEFKRATGDSSKKITKKPAFV